MWLKNGQKGREKTFLICMFFWSQNGCSSISIKTLLLLFVSGWTVVWFSRYLLTQENRKTDKGFSNINTPQTYTHSIHTLVSFLSPFLHKRRRRIRERERKEYIMAYDATLQFLKDDELEKLIRAGPLYDSAIHEKIPIQEWRKNAELHVLYNSIELLHNTEVMSNLSVHSDAIASRVYHFYLPILFRVMFLLEEHKKKQKEDMDSFLLSQEKKKEEKGESKKKEFYPKPLFIGIEAPQGLGKSTLVDVLQTLIDNSVVLSLDDLYLPREEQQDLGQKKHPGNPLLTFRGNPGTHDLPLARETIKKLKSINEGLGDGQTTVALPRYNKKACNGRGDRLPREDWPSVSGPTDIVFLEGWCLGFERPREFESLISSVDARVYFAPINEYLMEYESVFNNVIDSWMIIKAGDWRWAYEWRQEQERKNNGGLTDAQVRDFVDRFAPTYDACLQNLHDKVESKRLEDSRSAMLIEVNKDRSVKMNNEQVETITEILNKARERGAQEGDTEDLMID
jgi:D-glycerate 3-kinase